MLRKMMLTPLLLLTTACGNSNVPVREVVPCSSLEYVRPLLSEVKAMTDETKREILVNNQVIAVACVKTHSAKELTHENISTNDPARTS